MSVFGHRKIKLRENELATLLRFLGENPKKIFEAIRTNASEWSTHIDGGNFYVIPRIKGLEFHVSIPYNDWHGIHGPNSEERITHKQKYSLVKVVEFSRGVVTWADKRYI